jgi:hypothetical protein
MFGGSMSIEALGLFIMANGAVCAVALAAATGAILKRRHARNLSVS